ncbi:MAG TPA: NrsF family protein [Methylocella sp.]|nr:NrsF family protein [Methylocella sp.]
MKTDDLIRALAADSATRPMSLPRAFLAAMIPGAAIAFGLYLAVLGPRPHLLGLLAEPRFLFKVCLTLLLFSLSERLVMRLAKPGTDSHSAALMVLIVPLLLVAGIAAELLLVPVDLWGQRLIGTNALHCLKSIPSLGLAPLAAILWFLRQGAPENPGRAGAAAGLLAGAMGAALYATHCPDDSPLFVAVWYTLAIAFLSALGAVMGRRLLRW